MARSRDPSPYRAKWHVHYGDPGTLDNKYLILLVEHDNSGIMLFDGETGESFKLTAEKAKELSRDLAAAARMLQEIQP